MLRLLHPVARSKSPWAGSLWHGRLCSLRRWPCDSKRWLRCRRVRFAVWAVILPTDRHQLVANVAVLATEPVEHVVR